MNIYKIVKLLPILIAILFVGVTLSYKSSLNYETMEITLQNISSNVHIVSANINLENAEKVSNINDYVNTNKIMGISNTDGRIYIWTGNISKLVYSNITIKNYYINKISNVVRVGDNIMIVVEAIRTDIVTNIIMLYSIVAITIYGILFIFRDKIKRDFTDFTFYYFVVMVTNVVLIPLLFLL